MIEMKPISTSDDKGDMKLPDETVDLKDFFLQGLFSPIQVSMSQLPSSPPVVASSSYPPLPDLANNEMFAVIEAPTAKHETARHIKAESDQRTHNNFDNEDDRKPVNLTSSGRQSRSRLWPPRSDPPPTMMRPAVFQNRTIGETGSEAGRNLLAVFHGGDNVPRTRYNLQILRGRADNYIPSARYPNSNSLIPGGVTLLEICRMYPRHVWGTGLRMFIAEGWTGEQIYSALPANFKHSQAAQRPWNYLQQSFTREVKRVNDEDGVPDQSISKKRSAGEAELDDAARLPRPPPLPSTLPMLSPMIGRPAQQSGLMVPNLATSVGPVQTYNVPAQGSSQPAPALGGHPGDDTDHNLGFSYDFTNMLINFGAFERQAEIETQERLILQILGLKSAYWFESAESRLIRARAAREQILRMFKIKLAEAPLNHLKDLTVWLREELQIAIAQADV